MTCLGCVDNTSLLGAPEYGLSLRRSANKGCACACGMAGPQPQDAAELLGKTVTRASLRYERPTDDPQVTLIVN